MPRELKSALSCHEEQGGGGLGGERNENLEGLLEGLAK